MKLVAKVSIAIATLAIAIAVVLQIEWLRNDISQYIFENFIFSQFDRGILCVYLPNNKVKKFGKNKTPATPSSTCDASIDIKTTTFYYNMLINAGTNGLGETYMRGEWNEHKNDNLNLHSFVYYLVDNVVHAQQPFIIKLVKFLSPIEWINYMSYLPKTIANDQKSANIAYSFDNDFFRHMLDIETMTYSCAIFPAVSSVSTPDTGDSDSPVLVEAQFNKFAILLKKLNVTTSDMNILEIGGGWGTFSNYMHSQTYANITAINIAQLQLEFARKRFIKKNKTYDNRLHYTKLDYRDIVSHFGKESMDRVVSIGMLEHASFDENLNLFLREAYDVLKPGGRMVLHFISKNNMMPEWRDFSRIEDCCTYVTFIDQYIFPGACIVLADHVHHAADAVGLKLMHKEYYGQHYGKTLQYWRAKLESKKSKKYVVDKYGLEQYRGYKFGIALGEASFRVGIYDLLHMVFIKPEEGTEFQSDFHYKHKAVV